MAENLALCIEYHFTEPLSYGILTATFGGCHGEGLVDLSATFGFNNSLICCQMTALDVGWADPFYNIIGK